MRAPILLFLVLIVLLCSVISLSYGALTGNPVEDTITVFTGIAIGLAGLWGIINGVHRVDEGNVAVIRRVGRYGGVRGPGLIWVTPIIEEIARYHNVGMRPRHFIVEPVFAKDGLPLQLKLTTWYRLEPTAAGTDESQVALLFFDEQWYQTIRGELDAVVRRVVSNYRGMELLNNSKRQQDVENELVRQLIDRLRPRGVVLNPDRGAVLSGVDVEQRLKDALVDVTRIGIDADTKKSLLNTIYTEYPELSPSIVRQLIASVTGMEWRQVDVQTPTLLDRGDASGTPREVEPEHTPRISQNAWRRAIREVKDIDHNTNTG